MFHSSNDKKLLLTKNSYQIKYNTTRKQSSTSSKQKQQKQKQVTTRLDSPKNKLLNTGNRNNKQKYSSSSYQQINKNDNVLIKNNTNIIRNEKNIPKQRSRQMIKLMIDELQKQLQNKQQKNDLVENMQKNQSVIKENILIYTNKNKPNINSNNLLSTKQNNIQFKSLLSTSTTKRNFYINNNYYDNQKNMYDQQYLSQINKNTIKGVQFYNCNNLTINNPHNKNNNETIIKSTINNKKASNKNKKSSQLFNINQNIQSKFTPIKFIDTKNQQKTYPQKFSINKKKKINSSNNNQSKQISKQQSKINKQQFKKQLSPKNIKQNKTSSNKKQNYVFFGNDLIQVSNINLPLFILQNSHINNYNSNNSHVQSQYQYYNSSSKLYSSRKPYNCEQKYNNKQINIDQRSSFIRHSKIPSYQSINTQNSTHIKYIQRSFNDIENNDDFFNQNKQQENIQFFKLNKFINNEDKQIINNGPQIITRLNNQDKQKDSLQINNCQQKQLKLYNENNNAIDFNKIISLNNSVLKIQKWWRNITHRIQIQKQKQQQLIKKSIQTIQTKQQSEKNIQQNKLSHQLFIKSNQIPQSLSEKYISNSNQSEHQDILKLRQNAAYLQFSTHEQILKQLLQKGKITHIQFNQKLQHIKLNLNEQLADIKKIKDTLKQSAEKVQNMMKKTRDDILVVKKIVSQQNKKGQDQNNNILLTIFGGAILRPQQLVQVEQVDRVFEKKCKRLKVSVYEKQMQQFLDQREQQQDRSFDSNNNKRIFNSPNTGSQQDLSSPISNQQNGVCYNRQSFEQQDQQQQDIFTSQIHHAPSGSTQQSGISFPTANFEQLYKCIFLSLSIIEYQQQQQTKKQIQNRIAKQLGVIIPQQQLFVNTNQQQNNCGITTSIVGIHKFLLNFFKYYLCTYLFYSTDYHKNQFLTYMNMPYGQSIQTRLNKNKLPYPQQALQEWTKTTFYTDDDQQIIYGLKYVIPQSVLQEFFQSYYEQTDIQFSEIQKANIQLQKIHNRAVFKAFNQGLNYFRPYYGIGGAPYLWCSSQKSLTFYCIGQQNIQQVYQKTQMKLLKTSSYLCGVHTDVKQYKKVIYAHNNKEIISNINQVLSIKQQQCIEMQSPFKMMQNKQQSNSNLINVNKQYKQVNNFDQYLHLYTQNFNAAYLGCLQDRLKKKQLVQTQQQNIQWFTNTYQQGKVSTLLNLSNLIQQIILLEQCSIIQNIQSQKLKLQSYYSDHQYY